MVRIGGLPLTLLLAAVAFLQAGVRASPFFDKYEYSKSLFKRAQPTMGCTCRGLNIRTYTNGVLDTDYTTLGGQGLSMSGFGVNIEGWCFQNGVMTANDYAQITSALNSGVNTPYVNTTYAKYACSKRLCPSCTNAECATAIRNYFQTLLFAGTDYLAPCTYPASGFIPTTCNCAFTCTTSGYVQCGTSCMNSATQGCVSAPSRSEA